MEIMTYFEAYQLGLKEYYSGKACNKGHLAMRKIPANQCVECIRLAKAARDRRKVGKVGLAPNMQEVFYTLHVDDIPVIDSFVNYLKYVRTG